MFVYLKQLNFNNIEGHSENLMNFFIDIFYAIPGCDYCNLTQ